MGIHYHPDGSALGAKDLCSTLFNKNNIKYNVVETNTEIFYVKVKNTPSEEISPNEFYNHVKELNKLTRYDIERHIEERGAYPNHFDTSEIIIEKFNNDKIINKYIEIARAIK